MKTISVKKGDILQAKGDLNGKVYFVKSGLLRSYSIDAKGKEHVYMFAPENWILADNTHPDEPADLFIDVLENAVLEVNDKIFEAEHDRLRLIRRMSVLQKRIIMLMSSSAIDRYEHFEKAYPEIIQRVPQRMIASYLGITPEALSRVKKERSKK